MPEEYFDVAYINFEKAILHGRIRGGIDANRCVIEAMIEQVLTDDQTYAIDGLNFKHQMEMNELLSSFVDRQAALASIEEKTIDAVCAAEDGNCE